MLGFFLSHRTVWNIFDIQTMLACKSIAEGGCAVRALAQAVASASAAAGRFIFGGIVPTPSSHCARRKPEIALGPR
jgi:hypothetical protein